MTTIKNNWTVEEILDVYNTPLLELVYKAQSIHREFNDANEVQVSSLLSIKTGGCVEDCSYCPQAARYNTGVEVHKLMTIDEVSDAAIKLKKVGLLVYVWEQLGAKYGIIVILIGYWKW